MSTYSGKTFDEKLRLELSGHDENCLVLSKFFQEQGLPVDLTVWNENSWFHKLHRATQEIAAWIPPDDAFLLADEYSWGMEAGATRHPVPFPDPPDDATGIEALERWRQTGVHFLVIGWPAFWWFDYYSELYRYLQAHYRCLLSNNRLAIYDLRGAIQPH
jgi:hypothetical protein